MFASLACSLIFALVAPAAEPAKDAPAEKGPADLQGVWELQSIDIGGNDSDFGHNKARWVIKGAKLLYGGEEIATVTADAAAKPKTLDLTLADSKNVYEGIYSVEKDTWTICLNAHGGGVKERPQDFTTKDKENLRLVVFRRLKPDADGTEGGSGFVGLALGLDADRKMIVVNTVIDKSPAAQGGLLKDDIVLKVGEVPASDLRTTVEAVRQKKPGTEIVFHVRRDGKDKEVTVKVRAVPLVFLLQLD